MRFLVIGLGSMGKRRIRCLKHLDAAEILGFDPRQDRREEAANRYGIRTVDALEAGLAAQPDAVLISTPPDLHVPFALEAAKRNMHFFMEASVVEEGMAELEAVCASRSIVAAPSSTMRFHPSIRRVRELVEGGTLGAPLCFTHHVGHYLPDWHPWEDYRSFYVAKRETGGCREIVAFELGWLTWALGYPSAVACLKGNTRTLDVDIDDVYQLIMRHRSGLYGHLLVDVLARVPVRSFRCVLERGHIEFEWAARKVRSFSAASGEWTEHPEPPPIVEPGYVTPENMYIDEVRAFIDACAGKSVYPYTLADDRRTLHVLYEAERSSDTQQHRSLI